MTVHTRRVLLLGGARKHAFVGAAVALRRAPDGDRLCACAAIADDSPRPRLFAVPDFALLSSSKTDSHCLISKMFITELLLCFICRTVAPSLFFARSSRGEGGGRTHEAVVFSKEPILIHRSATAARIFDAREKLVLRKRLITYFV